MAKLIVGLGNPGEEYKNTRHNVGFKVLDSFSKKMNVSFDKDQFNGLFAVLMLNGEKIVIAKPQTFMNLSGQFVSKFMQYYNVNIEDLIVIYDDVDTNLGEIKLRTSGSSGGQNGVKNIIELLGTENFKRIKIGIGPKNTKMNLANFVLAKFSKDENEILAKVINLVTAMLSNINKAEFSNLLAYTKRNNNV